jgi:hypothetical protein
MGQLLIIPDISREAYSQWQSAAGVEPRDRMMSLGDATADYKRLTGRIGSMLREATQSSTSSRPEHNLDARYQGLRERAERLGRHILYGMALEAARGSGEREVDASVPFDDFQQALRPMPDLAWGIVFAGGTQGGPIKLVEQTD